MLPLLSFSGTAIAMTGKPKTAKSRAPMGELRLIGGQWRSRKLRFTEAEGLRPTGDRLRETLFNWLSLDIEGARCLDLFAGTGALGLEALSRGAAACDFVELNPASAEQIRQHLQTLGSDAGRVHTQDAAQFLQQTAARYDIVFLDPPFNKGLLTPLLPLLEPVLNDGAQVYMETAKGEIPLPPAGWQEKKQKQSRRVSYGLYQPSLK